MAAVEVHSTWERYVEDRLATALNHNSAHFIVTHDVRGVSRVSSGLAYYVVRSGGRYFDFKGTSDLLSKGDEWLGKPNNPFRVLSAQNCKYIDALAAIRNFIVHGSDAAAKAYKRHLKQVYGITYPPKPDEFLNAKDYRAASPKRYQTRIHGLVAIVEEAIRKTS